MNFFDCPLASSFNWELHLVMARTFATLPRWPSAALELRRVEVKDVKLCAELEAASYPADEAMAAMHLSVCELNGCSKNDIVSASLTTNKTFLL